MNENKLVAAEFFIDSEPGVGLGQAFNILKDTMSQFSGDIVLPTLQPGIHTLNIRTKDSIGVWSHVEQRNFYCNSSDVKCFHDCSC
ncbi:MAG: hypothetical protein IPN26_09080 [Bacteroidetes bacterium]|nr:hypothetical protein [Bacteroidota bacterium]